MKALWHSTAPFGNSSYSVLTARTVPDIVRLGHEVHVSTWYGLQGAPQRWAIRPRRDKNAPPVGTVMIYPSVNGASFGTDVLLATWEMLKPDVLITCMDVWVLPAALLSRMRAACWVPIDHDPCPQGVVDSLRACIYPMSFSRWGVDVLRAAGIEAHYVPCSADARVFRPMPKAEAREKLSVPDSCDMFISMVAANKDPGDRKGFGEALAGFATFAQSHPNALLYVHTNWEGPVNIGHLAGSLGLQGRVLRPEALPYLYGLYPDEYMRAVYAASDVLLNPAKSEGFGLPILEAQMCGTPVAISDFSTSDELLFGGWKIPGQKHWSIGADSFRLLVSIDGVADALEAAYAERGNEALRKAARAGAISLDTETVAKKYWTPALKEIEGLVSGAGELKLVTF